MERGPTKVRSPKSQPEPTFLSLDARGQRSPTSPMTPNAGPDEETLLTVLVAAHGAHRVAAKRQLAAFTSNSTSFPSSGSRVRIPSAAQGEGPGIPCGYRGFCIEWAYVGPRPDAGGLMNMGRKRGSCWGLRGQNQRCNAHSIPTDASFCPGKVAGSPPCAPWSPARARLSPGARTGKADGRFFRWSRAWNLRPSPPDGAAGGASTEPDIRSNTPRALRSRQEAPGRVLSAVASDETVSEVRDGRRGAGRRPGNCRRPGRRRPCDHHQEFRTSTSDSRRTLAGVRWSLRYAERGLSAGRGNRHGESKARGRRPLSPFRGRRYPHCREREVGRATPACGLGA